MKTRPVIFSPEAQDDLDDILDWLEDAASPQIALGYVKGIAEFCIGLGLGGTRGRARDHIDPGLRSIGYKKRVTILFEVESDRVVISRVHYGGRDWLPRR